MTAGAFAFPLLLENFRNRAGRVGDEHQLTPALVGALTNLAAVRRNDQVAREASCPDFVLDTRNTTQALGKSNHDTEPVTVLQEQAERPPTRLLKNREL